MKNYIVYKHTAPNGKVYIGQTNRGADDRWKNGKGYTCHKHGFFWKAIQKYGWDNIRHEILHEGLTKEEADYYEKYYIDFYKSTDRQFGYNCQSGGSRDYEYSADSRKNISESLKRLYKNSPPDTSKARSALREKQSRRICQYDLDGNKIAEFKSAYEAFQRTGISNARINGVVRDRKRRSQTGGFMWRYAEDSPDKIEPYKKNIPVVQYDRFGNKVKEWQDAFEADKEMSIASGLSKKRCVIEKCCKGKQKTAYGFMWRYKDEAEGKIKAVSYGKTVLQYSKEGKLISVFSSNVEAEAKTGVNSGNISACARGVYKYAGGYIWRYKEGEAENA